MKKRNFVRSGLIASALTAMAAVNAHATAMLDLSGASTAITAELAPALTAAMPIAGTIIAVGIGWKLYKRFCK